MSNPAPDRRRNISPLDRLGYTIATGAGAGLAPVAPGTFGAAEGVVLFVIIRAILKNYLALAPAWSLLSFAIINVALYAIGVWSSGRAIKVTGLKDPGLVVIDEVSGQLIALTPLVVAPSLAGVFVAFLLFRFFDIFKPYPIRKLEHFRAGFGVMADDALAGVYAAALVHAGILLNLI
jgi:phosphatidylglycerophosphatase A